MNWSSLAFGLALGLAPLLGRAANDVAAGAPTNRLALDWVLRSVLSNNPSLKAANANWEAMKQRIPQARAWEDARAEFNTRAGRFVDLPPNSMPDQMFSVEQMVPLSGRNRLRGQASTAEAVVAFEQLRRRELEITSRARAAYYRLANVYEQLDINRKNAVLLKQIVETGRTRYAAGRQNQGDVLLAESDLARLEATRAELERSLSDQQTELNVLMNRPAQSPLGQPAASTFFPVQLSLPHLQEMALAYRPELRGAQQEVQAAQARANEARRAWVPDPALRVQGIRYNEAAQAVSELDVAFSINLPWFNRGKYRAAIEEARQNHSRTQYELEALQTETLGLVRDRVKAIETSGHHVMVYRDQIMPLAQQAVQATQAAYETEQAGLVDLLLAQRSSLEAQAMYWNNLADYLAGLSELESLVGGSFSARAQTASTPPPSQSASPPKGTQP